LHDQNILTMLSQPNHAVDEGDDNQIISPFAQTTSKIRPSSPGGKISWPLWIVSVVLLLVVVGNAAYFGLKYLHDPYRTLEPFSADKYLADFQPLMGNKFKADLKVTADLGWKENVGRLMAFTALNDSRPILVLIPPKLSGIFFTKGQTYQVALEVGEGGLIYADSCEKD
jgi:hypothetical protein